jgi:hypothetical protein
MLDAPLKMVPETRAQSALTLSPPAYFNSLGTTVQPSRTPVKPAGLEKEFTSMAQALAPSISKIDFGSAGSRMYPLYAASKMTRVPRSRAAFTSAASCSRPAVAPVGLLGEQK